MRGAALILEKTCFREQSWRICSRGGLLVPKKNCLKKVSESDARTCCRGRPLHNWHHPRASTSTSTHHSSVCTPQSDRYLQTSILIDICKPQSDRYLQTSILIDICTPQSYRYLQTSILIDISTPQFDIYLQISI